MYDIPILAPEDRAEQPREYPVGQPLNALDGYSMEQGTFVSNDMDDPNPKYWIECVQEESCGGQGLYRIHKGLYPNPVETIMTCSKGTVHDSCTTGDELVFNCKGITQAELRYIRGQQSRDRWGYSLRDQQGELGLVYVYDDNNDKIEYYPFFQLHRISSRSSSSPVVIISLILLVLGIYLASSYEEAGVIISIIFFLIVLILCCCSCFSASCGEDGVSRSRMSNVIDMTTHQLVADVYGLAGTCGNHSNDIEIVCHRAVSKAQLMGLISLAILSESKRKREEDKKRANSQYIQYN